jgi:hypothetical protein
LPGATSSPRLQLCHFHIRKALKEALRMGLVARNVVCGIIGGISAGNGAARLAQALQGNMVDHGSVLLLPPE